ncbi:DUF3263 domain-containing protein [Actinoalloteichus spitiensis]|uniref:DUF3263 domain-containing protein n=1 Tax=Actinoalloteichus spitiensis TaxID=252394 RepID=UPI0012F667EC|nr:DUF3263 domain-containing protein [Actinoalloteichus spitiensis]
MTTAWPPDDPEEQVAAVRFATSWWRYPGSLEQAARERYGVTGARFWQGINSLITERHVMAALPNECNRLLRLRDRRRVARARRRGGYRDCG